MAGIQETLAVLVLFLACLRSALADIDCESESSIYQLQTDCFLEQGINIILPPMPMTNYVANTKRNYIATILTQKTDLMCTNQEKMKKAMKCAMTQPAKCMPFEYRSYYPRPESMEQVVATVCNGMTKEDFECVMNKASELFDCLSAKGRAFSESEQWSPQDLLCQIYPITAECQRSVLMSCGCPIVMAQETVYLDLMYPPGCPRPALYGLRTKCDETNPPSFMDNGGQPHLGSIYFVFGSSLLVLLYLSAV